MTDRVPPRVTAAQKVRSVLPLVVIVLALPVAPLSLRIVNALSDTTDRNRSYRPSIESRAARKSFDPGPIESLRHGNPRWVFIGDSMLGTRIHPTLLKELAETGDRNVMELLQAASGPSWWYLSFKNLLVPSGIKPRMTFFGDALDEVAHEQEPELDRIVAVRRRGAWWWVEGTSPTPESIRRFDGGTRSRSTRSRRGGCASRPRSPLISYISSSETSLKRGLPHFRDGFPTWPQPSVRTSKIGAGPFSEFARLKVRSGAHA